MRKDDRVVFMRIFGFLKPHIRKYLLIAVLIAVSTIVGFFQPLLIQALTDKGLVQRNMKVVFGAASILTILVAINQFVSIYLTSLFEDIHNGFYSSLFQQVIDKLFKIKLDYFTNRNDAEVQSVLQTDVSNVSSITDVYITSTLGNLFKIVSGLIGLAIISWQLTIFIMSIIPIKICIVTYCSKKQEIQTEECIEQSRTIAQWLGDTIGGIAEVKLWGLSTGKRDLFLHHQNKLLQQEKHIKMLTEWNLFGEMLVEWGANILIYVIGCFMICSDKLSLGAVCAFVSYSWYVTGPVSALLNLKMYFARVLPSAKRLFKFLDMETESDDGKGTVKGKPPRIEFKLAQQFDCFCIMNNDANAKFDCFQLVRAVFKPNGKYPHLLVPKFPKTFKVRNNFSLLIDHCIRWYILSPFDEEFFRKYRKELQKESYNKAIIENAIEEHFRKSAYAQNCVEYVYKQTNSRRLAEEHLKEGELKEKILREYIKFMIDTCEFLADGYSWIKDSRNVPEEE